jgi:hypothetical protein
MIVIIVYFEKNIYNINYINNNNKKILKYIKYKIDIYI